MADFWYVSSYCNVFWEKNDFSKDMSRFFCEMDRYGDWIRKVTQDVDFIRLIITRGRRMVLLSQALFAHVEVYGAWVRFLDSFIQGFVLYQVCVLLPRFLANTFYMLRHLDAEWSRDMTKRSWEMVYDFGWITNGFLSFFVLIGPLAPCAIYLTVATPSYHLLMHMTRLLINIYHGKNLEEHYTELMPLIIHIAVSLCVVSAAVIILMGFANPIVPFVAATVAVLATIAGRVLPDYFVPQQAASSSPDEPKATSLDGVGMFHHRKPVEVEIKVHGDENTLASTCEH